MGSARVFLREFRGPVNRAPLAAHERT